MNRADREAWILRWIDTHRHASVLDAPFVDAYVQATGARFERRPWGAHKCRQLGLDLSNLHSRWVLHRYRVGLARTWQRGFPTWVYVYDRSGGLTAAAASDKHLPGRRPGRSPSSTLTP